ncbi:unnamed protein product [Fraxinus pennsylvanica]|uniref:S-protein homolog n=1 Tax=Fraxinus pennsylvanica TaxID=56036 RepID=A0AAD1YYL0_9LAMI|nr:unnamed protein product [Fraxinus pennsylvanica]
MANLKLKCHITKKCEVHTVNNLPRTLTLHCASGDDDLGFHNLTINNDFHGKFCESYLGVTLFFCHLFGVQMMLHLTFSHQERRKGVIQANAIMQQNLMVFISLDTILPEL